MRTMIDSTSAVGLYPGVDGDGNGDCCSFVTIANYCPFWSSDDSTRVHSAFRRLSHASCFDVSWNRARRLIDGCSFTMRNALHPWSKVRATEEYSGSGSDPLEGNVTSNYHPFKEIVESISQDGGDARLTATETTRTLR